MRFLQLLLLATIAPGCVAIGTREYHSDSDPTVLRRVEANGTRTTWRLHARDAGAPVLERTDVTRKEVAHLGLQTSSLERERAEHFGLAPFSALRVSGVTGGKPAQVAGVRAGDVLVAVGGVPVTSPEQFSDLVVNDLEIGRPVQLDLRRRSEEGIVELQVDVTPTQREVEDSATTSTPVRGSGLVRSLCGLEVAELSAELAGEVVDHSDPPENPRVYVARVDLGSPAYLAGLRSGDHIEALDGAPLVSLEPLVAAVIARADERGFDVASPERNAFDGMRSATGPLVLEVRGPLGPHRATVDVRDDLAARTGFGIPIVFHYESDLDSTRWSLLDFIFQFGANSRSRYLESDTRSPAKHSFFSMLPFGFYERDSRPSRTRYRIFWFIRWEQRR